MTPKISVIMSTFCRNRGDSTCPNLLRRALDSILGQTFKDFELILIDDASKDGSEKVCREYADKDSRIRFFRMDKNSGGLPAKRYNDGMSLAKSDLFMFMFDDDMWFPNAIQDMFSEISASPDLGMAYGLSEFVNSKTGVVSKNFGEPWDYHRLCRGNFLCNFSVIVRRSVIDKVGGYDEDPVLRRLCDWDLWVRIGAGHKVVRVGKTIGRCFHSQPDSIGITVSISDVDMEKISRIQKSKRNVRLKEELSRKMRISFAYTDHDETLRRWSMGYLSDALNEEGLASACVDVRTEEGRNVCRGSDLIVFYRTVDLSSLAFADSLKKAGKRVFYSIDDYIFQSQCKAAKDHEKVILPFLKMADAVVSPSSKLLEKTGASVKILRRNVLDRKTMEFLAGGAGSSSHEGCGVGWFVGVCRNENDSFVSGVLRILDAKTSVGEKFRFCFFGQHSLGTYNNISLCQQRIYGFNDWQGLYMAYKEFGLTAIINPLDEKDEFFACKSELKYVEAGAMGVPLIVSRIAPFTEVIREGENGFFASTQEEFADKILTVCRNPSLACDVGKRAQKHVQLEYNSTVNARKFIADILPLMKSSPVKLEMFANLVLLGQLDTHVVIGPIGSGDSFEMTVFFMPACHIKGFSLLGATYCKRVRTGALFQLWIDGKKAREGRVSPAVMLDNSWWDVEIEPLKIESEMTLTIRLINQDASVNLALYPSKEKVAGKAKLGVQQVGLAALRFTSQE